MSVNRLRSELIKYRLKFHKVEFIRGLIFWCTACGLSFAALSLLEYLSYWSTTVKTTLLIAWLLISIALALFWWLRPALALFFNVGAITDKQAARMIGRHFPEVEDRLVNWLELEEEWRDSDYLASIVRQRTGELSGLHFDMGITWKRVQWAAIAFGLPLILMFVFGLFDSKHRLFEGSNRLLNYTVAYSPSAPFTFVSNGPWTVERGEAVKIELHFEGDIIPSSASLIMDGVEFPMQRSGEGSFFWNMERANKSVGIQFKAVDFYSDVMELRVLPVPAFRAIRMEVVPPQYTGIAPFPVEGSGDGVVPVGSRVQWSMLWDETDAVFLVRGDSKDSLLQSSGEWHYTDNILEAGPYRISGSNRYGTEFISGTYNLDIIPDLTPDLSGELSIDSVSGRIYLSGSVTDDYGITKLELKLAFDDREEVVELSRTEGTWRYAMDLPNEPVNVSVWAWDNDGVFGSKKSILGPWHLEPVDAAGRRERAEEESAERLRSISDLRQEQQRTEELQENMERQLIENEQRWKLERNFRQLQSQEERLMNEWNRMRDALSRENRRRILESPNDERNRERRERLEELMQEMDPERLQELLEQLEELDNPTEEEMQRWMRELNRENQTMERNLERLEELMKQLSFEQNLERRIEELQEMQEQQEDLSNTDADSSKAQQELNEKFSEWQERMEELEKENEALKKPLDFNHDEEQSDSTKKSMDESLEELNESEPDKANQKQQKSSEQMQQMMQKLKQSAMAMEMEMHVENLEHLRRILTNLLHLSDSQEQLSERATNQQAGDRIVVDWMKQEQKIRSNYQLVDDSLTALIARVPQIEAHVTKWMEEASFNMDESKNFLGERELASAASHMRSSLMALNELSLILDVTMDQIQQMMSAMMQGDQSCEKPGGAKPSPGNMSKMQKALQEQMSQMKGVKQGSMSGEGQQGGRSGMSQEIVEMMARQEQIRKMMEESGSGNQQLIDMLKENEKDLAEQHFDTEFFERQKEIEVKMLELETAERTQERREERESDNLTRYQELRKQREEEFLRDNPQLREELRFSPPALMPFYRDLSRSYLRNR